MPARLQRGPHSPEPHTSTALPSPLLCHTISPATSLCPSWEQSRWPQRNHWPVDVKSWDSSLLQGLITGLGVAWNKEGSCNPYYKPKGNELDSLQKISIMQEKRVRARLNVDGKDTGKLGQASLFCFWKPLVTSCLPLNDAQSLRFYLVPAQHHVRLILISITSHTSTSEVQVTCGSTISA